MKARVIDFIFLKILFIIFLEREEGRERGREHQCVVASQVPPTRDLALNPGMCPDQESNKSPFGSQVGTQSLSHTCNGKFFQQYKFSYFVQNLKQLRLYSAYLNLFCNSFHTEISNYVSNDGNAFSNKLNLLNNNKTICFVH